MINVTHFADLAEALGIPAGEREPERVKDRKRSIQLKLKLQTQPVFTTVYLPVITYPRLSHFQTSYLENYMELFIYPNI